ncbi:hypothetical protein LTR16_008332, partial [Cryomyces antarcticus]
HQRPALPRAIRRAPRQVLAHRVEPSRLHEPASPRHRRARLRHVPDAEGRRHAERDDLHHHGGRRARAGGERVEPESELSGQAEARLG